MRRSKTRAWVKMAATNLIPPRNKITEGHAETARLIRSQLVEAGKTFGLKLNGNYLWNDLYVAVYDKMKENTECAWCQGACDPERHMWDVTKLEAVVNSPSRAAPVSVSDVVDAITQASPGIQIEEQRGLGFRESAMFDEPLREIGFVTSLSRVQLCELGKKYGLDGTAALNATTDHALLVDQIRVAMVQKNASCLGCPGVCSPHTHRINPISFDPAPQLIPPVPRSTATTTTSTSPVTTAVTTTMARSINTTTSVWSSTAAASSAGSTQPPGYSMAGISPLPGIGLGSSISLASTMPYAFPSGYTPGPPVMSTMGAMTSTAGMPGIGGSGIGFQPQPFLPYMGAAQMQQQVQQQMQQQMHQQQLQMQMQEQQRFATLQETLAKQFEQAQLQQKIQAERFQADMQRQLAGVGRGGMLGQSTIPSVPPLAGAAAVHTETSTTLSDTPENPGIFGLEALEPINVPRQNGKINREAMIFCGANVGPLLSASDVREGTKRKVLSGQYSSALEEVKSQIFWPQAVLDAVLAPVRPDYSAMSPVQFSAGFSAMMLLYMPQELYQTPLANMLKYFNRLLSFAMNSDWKSVLAFNGQFLHACENHQVSFADWKVVKAWLDRHLEAGRLRSTGDKKNTGEVDADVEKKKNPNFVPESFARKHNLCLKFQSGRCDKEGHHQVGKTTLQHVCSLCLLKERGVVTDHGAKECPKKEKYTSKGF